MKYLLLIIRHLFPRRIWTDASKVNIGVEHEGGMPEKIVIIQRDQFGNLRKFTIS